MSEQQEMSLKEWVEKLPEHHFARKEYNELMEDQRTLRALEAGGVDNWNQLSTFVDNWSGYDFAMEGIWAEEE